MINCFYSIVVCANYKKVQIIGLKNGEKVQVIKFCKLCSNIEHFKNFIDTYNEKVKANGEEDKEINYTDTTGILMGSVKTIVNAFL